MVAMLGNWLEWLTAEVKDLTEKKITHLPLKAKLVPQIY